MLETYGLTPTLVAVDAMEKAAGIRVLQCEVNDMLGVVTKIAGSVAAVATAIEAGRAAAEPMGGQPIAQVLPRPDPLAWESIQSPPTFNPLIEQNVVFFPEYQPVAGTATEDRTMSQAHPNYSALGFIETQGFTAVYDAIDTACKAANVQVIGKEKLGGGYICVVITGDLAAVTAAVEAGREKVEGLGKLIAAHVLARPSPSVLGLLPK